MRTSKPLEQSIGRLVVDANPILSALIRDKAQDIFLSPLIGEFATTQFTTEEVKEYIPELVRKPKVKGARITEGDLYAALSPKGGEMSGGRAEAATAPKSPLSSSITAAIRVDFVSISVHLLSFLISCSSFKSPFYPPILSD